MGEILFAEKALAAQRPVVPAPRLLADRGDHRAGATGAEREVRTAGIGRLPQAATSGTRTKIHEDKEPTHRRSVRRADACRGERGAEQTQHPGDLG